jgi:hypothetical protein
MVAAMFIGMAVPGMATRLAFALRGHADLLTQLETRVVVMVLSTLSWCSAWVRA